MFNYNLQGQDGMDLSIYLNDDIIKVCKENPGHFIGLGTIPMQSPEHAMKELKRIMSKGMAGVQIGSHVENTPLGDSKFFPIYELAEQLGACIFVHPWEMAGEEKMKKYWLPWLVGMPMETSFAICSLMFSGVFTKFPRLRFMFAHGGGSFPATIGRIEHGWKVRPDLVAIDESMNPRSFCGKFWLDSLVHDPVAFKLVADLVGKEKIALGTDYPFPLGELQPGELISEATFLSDAEKQDMLWKNAFQWLGMDDKPFLGRRNNSDGGSDSDQGGDRGQDGSRSHHQ
jgi:aminocarboxymuconate-semialdehyde decarboxylase